MTTVTQHDIAAALRALGLGRGHTVLAHSALSRFGHVEGGADAVIDALLAVVTPEGTVMVPTLTGDETHSAANPPVFDPLHTPCWTGTIPETLRKRAGAVRSVHPTHSVAAIGAGAAALTEDHINAITPCDMRSPYGRLAEQRGGFVLLLGVDHEASTTFHCVEEIVGVDYHMQPDLVRATLILEGGPVYRHYLLHQWGTPRNYSIMEPVFIERGIQRTGRIGNATVRLIDAAGMFEVTVQALKANPRLLCARL